MKKYIEKIIEFNEIPKADESRFLNINKAEQWCRDNWYSFWSMARDMPIWLMKWDWGIAKWYNLSDKDIEELDWKIVFDNITVKWIFHKTCKILIYNK